MKMAVSLQVLIWAMVGLVGLVFLIILIMRHLLYKRSEQLLRQKHRKGQGLHAYTSERTKYAEVDAYQFSPLFFKLGLAATLILAILAFSWTTFGKRVDVRQYMDTLEQDIEVAPPRTTEPPPPPPPPPPPVIQEVPNELITDEEEVEFVDQSVDRETVIERPQPI